MFDIDHILTREALDFIRRFDGLKIQFIREFGVLDECGILTQDLNTLADYGMPPGKSLRVRPLPNNFAMRRNLFWDLGGYREDLVEKSYPQGEDRAFRSVWRTFDPVGEKVCTHRPIMYVFPTGKLCGDVDHNPKGLFHSLSRKTSRNFCGKSSGEDSVRICKRPHGTFAQDLGHHFGAIVRTDVSWNPIQQHGVGQGLDDADGVDLPGYTDGKAFAGELINERHQPDSPAILGLGLYKVEAPDMVGMFRPEPDA